jgi:hypothetical protein
MWIDPLNLGYDTFQGDGFGGVEVCSLGSEALQAAKLRAKANESVNLEGMDVTIG